MAVQQKQVTLGSGATAFPWSSDYWVPWVLLVNNAANPMMAGSSAVTSTHGIPLSAGGGSFFIPTTAPRGVNLSSWYVIGTSAQILDVIYEDGL